MKCCKYCRKPIRKHISEKISLKKLKPITEASEQLDLCKECYEKIGEHYFWHHWMGKRDG